MHLKIRDVGVARHIGKYSDAIESVSGLRWLYSSGTPGLMETGEIPGDFATQARLAWHNVLRMLAQAGMSVSDLVKVTTSLTRPDDIPAYARIRSEFLGEVRPAFMLQIVQQLIDPRIFVEIEIVAAALIQPAPGAHR
jgi:2-iminobutanoate/2-iminopropanoate deaminase